MQFEPNTFRAFEAYGFAVATASVLEVTLRFALVQKAAARIDRSQRDAGALEKETAKVSKRLFRATFGNLVQWTVDQFDLPAHVKQGLRLAVSSRDELIHHFWQLHLGSLATEEGLDLIGADCNVTAQRLMLVADEFIRHSGVNASGYVEHLKRQAAARLAENVLATTMDDL